MFLLPSVDAEPQSRGMKSLLSPNWNWVAPRIMADRVAHRQCQSGRLGGGWRRSGRETAGLRRSRSAARSLFRSGWRSGAVSPPKAQPGGSPLRPPRPRADPRKSGGIAVTNSYPAPCLTGSKASRTLVGHGAAEPGVDKHHMGMAPALSDLIPGIKQVGASPPRVP